MVLLVLEEEGVGQVGRRGSKRRAPSKVTQARVSLSLTGVVVKVGDQTEAKGVCAVQALDNAQIAGCLSHALPETQTTIVHCQGMSVKITFASRSMKHLQMVNSHLQNLCFFQFG